MVDKNLDIKAFKLIKDRSNEYTKLIIEYCKNHFHEWKELVNNPLLDDNKLMWSYLFNTNRKIEYLDCTKEETTKNMRKHSHVVEGGSWDFSMSEIYDSKQGNFYINECGNGNGVIGIQGLFYPGQREINKVESEALKCIRWDNSANWDADLELFGYLIKNKEIKYSDCIYTLKTAVDRMVEENYLKIEDDIIAGETFEDVAKKHGAKYVSVKPFSSDKRPSDDVLSDKIVAGFWDMDEGVESEIVETKKGFIIARVDKIIPAHTEEFESVKHELVADWKRDAQKKQAYVRANELLVDLNKDGVLSGAKSASVSRTTGAPIDVLNAVFNNSVETNTIVPSADAFYVLRIKSEKTPQPDAKKMADVRKGLETSSDVTIMDDYNSFLIREYPVRVNEKVFNRVFAK